MVDSGHSAYDLHGTLIQCLEVQLKLRFWQFPNLFTQPADKSQGFLILQTGRREQVKLALFLKLRIKQSPPPALEPPEHDKERKDRRHGKEQKEGADIVRGQQFVQLLPDRMRAHMKDRESGWASSTLTFWMKM
jgi:hypothetical protein